MEQQNNGFQLEDAAKDYLRESAKWSMFLAILGFIGIGFLALLAIIMTGAASMMPETPGPFGKMRGLISLIYLVFAILYLFPIYYLFKYADNTKKAINSGNTALLTSAFSNLKSHHKFLGIASIIIIALYILAAIVMVIGFTAMM
ncbi:DUF5362 family protein [Flavobacterium sp. j3]|uniref:DUF5362 family protein n=1 Tax=Flavobacterium aureirubrum TaxID=3133147 RepID=A0ABU9N6C3_9FLAO